VIKHYEDLGLDGKIILKWILKAGCVGVDWIHLTQCRVQWRVPVIP